jgi:hypothetical protein
VFKEGGSYIEIRRKELMIDKNGKDGSPSLNILVGLIYELKYPLINKTEFIEERCNLIPQ